MKNFKAVITTNKSERVGRRQTKVVLKLPFDLKVEIDKNNQIYSVQPRTFNNIDLFSKYYGRTSDHYLSIIEEINMMR